MIFSLDVIRARKGDCLILHYGSASHPRLMIIDGGPRGVYFPHLKPRLEAIRLQRGLAPDAPLLVDLLMVSHVDDDHIHGILDFTRDLIHDNPRFAQVLSFWHNSFESVLGDTPKDLTSAFKTRFGAASMDGDPPDPAFAFGLDDTTIRSALKVLASVKQGEQLRGDVLDRLRIELNPDFQGQLILARGNGEPLDMGDGLSFTLIGPMLPELEELHGKHQAWLKDLENEGKSVEDVLSAYVDPSVPNLSSIVVLAEAEGKRMLLTGDARGDKILEGLELERVVTGAGTLHVDILKVPHHGSSNNLDRDFFERITADHYVFSGDGQHGNPERESVEMLIDARRDADFKLHFTYPIDVLDKAREADWVKEQDKEKKKKEKNSIKTVREDWSPENHSLHSLFERHPEVRKNIRIVGDDGPHVIDLLEEIGL